MLGDSISKEAEIGMLMKAAFGQNTPTVRDGGIPKKFNKPMKKNNHGESFIVNDSPAGALGHAAFVIEVCMYDGGGVKGSI